jgi:hypothetical protein
MPWSKRSPNGALEALERVLPLGTRLEHLVLGMGASERRFLQDPDFVGGGSSPALTSYDWSILSAGRLVSATWSASRRFSAPSKRELEFHYISDYFFDCWAFRFHSDLYALRINIDVDTSQRERFAVVVVYNTKRLPVAEEAQLLFGQHQSLNELTIPAEEGVATQDEPFVMFKSRPETGGRVERVGPAKWWQPESFPKVVE